jgi:protein-L-isoaspartate O-methyltransferase
MENPAKEVPSGEPISSPSLRKEMAARDIAARGVRDELVLDAMRKVPRELFLPEKLREFAYDDTPLPIAGEQTISQPYIVAFMAEALMLKGRRKGARDRSRIWLRRRRALGDSSQRLHGRTARAPCRKGCGTAFQARLSIHSGPQMA